MSKAMQLKAKIKNLAMKNHISAQAVLQNFMLERLLERISISKYKDMVILKGGMLIASLVGINSRTTMDPVPAGRSCLLVVSDDCTDEKMLIRDRVPILLQNAPRSLCVSFEVFNGCLRLYRHKSPIRVAPIKHG